MESLIGKKSIGGSMRVPTLGNCPEEKSSKANGKVMMKKTTRK